MFCKWHIVFAQSNNNRVGVTKTKSRKNIIKWKYILCPMIYSSLLNRQINVHQLNVPAVLVCPAI